MRFVDEAKITVISGNGGHGCASFRREKYVPKGGPDGGDGGRGGDVLLRANSKLLTLYDFRIKRRYTAKNGLPGMGKDRYGKAADPLVIDLPVGTQVYEVHEEENGETSQRLLIDLTEDGKEILVCEGGRGGRGNIHFKSSVNRAPRYAEDGKPGEEKNLRLELKILADVGLLGLPNAGKSTLVSSVSAAKPKIASYPFTTLVPNLGVLEDDFGVHLVMADIPGLIEGASEGQGLGHTFLRHVERNRFLVHLLGAEEVGDGSEGTDPFAGFALLDEELRRYSPELAEKDQIRVVNKIDLLSDDRLAELRAAAEKAPWPVRFISAMRGDGVDELVDEIWERYHALEEAEKAARADDEAESVAGQDE